MNYHKRQDKFPHGTPIAPTPSSHLFPYITPPSKFTLHPITRAKSTWPETLIIAITLPFTSLHILIPISFSLPSVHLRHPTFAFPPPPKSIPFSSSLMLPAGFSTIHYFVPKEGQTKGTWEWECRYVLTKQEAANARLKVNNQALRVKLPPEAFAMATKSPSSTIRDPTGSTPRTSSVIWPVARTCDAISNACLPASKLQTQNPPS